MARPTQAPDRVAFLNELNATVEAEQQFLDALKKARELIVQTALTVPPNGTPPRPHRKQRQRSGVSHGSRTAMLQTILDNAPHPVTVAEIEEEMAKHGRHDERRLIYSTLSYLARKNTAKTAERGKWVSVTATAQQQVDVAA